MLVGIDARMLGVRVTGIGRYTAELTKELINKSGEFYLYSARSVATEHW